MNTNDVMPVLDAVKLIEGFETFSASPMVGPGGVPQIGYGTRVYLDGRAVELEDQPITPVYAESLLVVRLTNVAHSVWSYLKRTPNVNQYNALLSLADDVGADQIGPSMLIRKFNGGDNAGAAGEFAKWTHRHVDAGLVELPSAASRRASERDLFMKEPQSWRIADPHGATNSQPTNPLTFSSNLSGGQ